MYILIGKNLIKQKKVIKSILSYKRRSLVVKQHANKGRDTV